MQAGDTVYIRWHGLAFEAKFVRWGSRPGTLVVIMKGPTKSAKNSLMTVPLDRVAAWKGAEQNG